MPIYVYKAKDRTGNCDCCSKGMEVLQILGEPPIEKCPKCGRTVERVISSFSVGISRTGLDRRAREKGLHKLRKLNKDEYEKVF
jgi:putative FmdB family regulatory protein